MTHLSPADLDLMPPLLHSLATLMRLRGMTVSSQSLLANLAGSATVGACQRAAERTGMQCRIMPRPQLADISPLTLPCILLLKQDRSCVLLELDTHNATIILPENGHSPSTVSRQSLEEAYAGHALFGMPQSRLDQRTEGVSIARGKRWFWDVLLHYAPIYRHTIFASVFINLIAVASPLFVMNVYDRVVPNKAMETLWVLALGIGVAYIFDCILRAMRSHFVDTAGRNADVVLSSLLLDKVLTMRLDAKPESTGALVNNVREFESLREFFSSSSMLACVDLPFLFLFLLVMGFIGGPLVILPIVAMPVMLGAGLCLQRLAQRSAESSYKQHMHKNALLVEMVNGLETLKVCQAESRMQRLWESVCGISAKTTAENRKYASLAIIISTFITQLVTVSMTIWGVYLIADGSLTMGGLIGSNILVGRAMAPLLQMAQLLTRLQHSRISLQALDLLMATPSEQKGQQHMDFGPLEPNFTLEQVTFAYPGAQRNALEDVNVHIAAGEKVGIMGPMGSGKSTLGKLLAGLYPPKQGAVSFGNVDIRQLPCADLRGRIGFLQQDSVLFYGSIRDNIALGDPVINDGLILRAAELAGVTDFVKRFPAGFGTQVGEQGKALSGGQRQAVALARALVRDPDVLILDEPGSHMDKASEQRICQRIASVLEGKTVILISHRPTMLQLVDRIIVMDQGTIVMDGAREQVLQALGFASQGEKRQPHAIRGSVAQLFSVNEQ